MVLVLGVISLVVSLIVLREAKVLLKGVQELTSSLQRETLELIKESTAIYLGTRGDVARARDLLEIAEMRSDAMNQASKVALGAIAAPIVRVKALKLGVSRARKLFRLRRSI